MQFDFVGPAMQVQADEIEVSPDYGATPVTVGAQLGDQRHIFLNANPLRFMADQMLPAQKMLQPAKE